MKAKDREIADLNQKNIKFEDEVKKLTTNVSILMRRSQVSHYKLLLGSIGYNFINALSELILGKPKAKQEKNHLHTVEDIKKLAVGAEEKKLFEEWEKNINWKPKYDLVLKRFTKDRVSIAHPVSISLDEDSDTPAEPKDLNNAVKFVYNNKNEEDFRKCAEKVIGFLDTICRKLKRPLLITNVTATEYNFESSEESS